VGAFTLYPFAQAIWTSLQIDSPILEPHFAGVDNYVELLTSEFFGAALRVTLQFSFIATPLVVTLAVLAASLLNQPFPGNAALRVGMLIPWALPASAVGVIWKWLFIDQFGALNALLYSSHLISAYVPWLTTPSLAMFAVIVAHIWAALPLATILVLVAMRAIPADLYDAAAIDGAGVLHRFRHVTLPGIRPMLVIVAIYEAILALTSFDITFSLTHGGPGTATTLITYFTWSESFKMLNFGHGAALAIIIAVGTLVAILGLLRALPPGALMDVAPDARGTSS
jgi:ABC-type sugar transport system permease subunit